MRSLIFEGVGRVTVATVADPTILAPSDAVVAVKATAVRWPVIPVGASGSSVMFCALASSSSISPCLNQPVSRKPAFFAGAAMGTGCAAGNTGAGTSIAGVFAYAASTIGGELGTGAGTGACATACVATGDGVGSTVGAMAITVLADPIAVIEPEALLPSISVSN